MEKRLLIEDFNFEGERLSIEDFKVDGQGTFIEDFKVDGDDICSLIANIFANYAATKPHASTGNMEYVKPCLWHAFTFSRPQKQTTNRQ